MTDLLQKIQDSGESGGVQFGDCAMGGYRGTFVPSIKCTIDTTIEKLQQWRTLSLHVHGRAVKAAAGSWAVSATSKCGGRYLIASTTSKRASKASSFAVTCIKSSGRNKLSSGFRGSSGK